jgi:PPM family protein phosphatase
MGGMLTVNQALSTRMATEGGMWRRDVPWGTATHKGHVRTRNEDALLVESELGLYAVLDGMGGAASGDVASNLAARTLATFVRQNLRTQELRLRDLLEAALNTAAIAVHELATNSTEHRGMGTTVVTCLLGAAREILIAHAGDSRAYLLRDHRMRQLTRDHTLWQEYIDDGRPLADTNAYLKRVVTRNLGQDPGVAPDVLEETLEVGDRLLLCSDGLNEVLPDEVIQQILSSPDAPSHIAQRLVETALVGPCPDNVSVLVLDASE